MFALVVSLAIATAKPTPPPDPVIATVGDIVCDPRPTRIHDIEDILGGCSAGQTYALVAHRKLAAVLTLGDEQYEDGALVAFQQAYAKTWGHLKAITRPTPGNHEYYSGPHADGYFTYFGRVAGDPSKGYYSFDLAGWHMISLNGNCDFVAGCGEGSPQERWLRSDLAADHQGCTLAYWHQPRFSSGFHHDDRGFVPFWTDLYAAHADIVLGGHDHDYERYALQTPMGDADPRMGVREFVVGTGGRSHTFFLRIDKNSEARASGTFGVMFLTLHKHGYDWQFSPVAGYLFSDQGSSPCHGRGAR
jgi:acid phosphatase type 7